MSRTTSIAALRSRLAWQIVVFNLLLMVLTIVYYVLKGIDAEDFSSIITLLTAISAIYVGTLFQYLGKSLQSKTKKIEPSPPPKLARIVAWIVPIHFMLIAGIITLRAIPQINFTEMNLLLALIEATFGGYIGYIITALFQLEKLKKDEN